MGLTQGGEQRFRHRRAAVAPSRDDDGPGLFKQFHPAVGQHLNATHGTHRPLVDGDDTVLIPREIELWPRQAEDLHGDAEFESAEAVVGQNRDQSRGGLHLAENSR